jgi:hypothetical protein
MCIDKSGLAACTESNLRCIGCFSPAPPANGKQESIPEEMSQTLLTKRSEENLKHTPTTLLS